MRKVIFLIFCICSTVIVKAQQIYGAANGLTATPATGTTRTVSLGGTMTAATSLDYTTSTAANFLIKKATANYFFVGNDGKIGIGTAAPTSLFSLGSGVANSKLAVWDNGTTLRSGLGWATGQLRLHLSATTDKFSFLSTEAAATDLMTILGTGNVGIGTATPANKLSIAGGTATNFGLQFPGLTNATATGTNTNKVLTLDAAGNIIWSNVSTNFANGITGILSFANGGTGLSVLGTANQQLRINAAGTALEYFTPAGGGASQWTTAAPHIYYTTGNVGIGTSTPSQNLHIFNSSSNSSLRIGSFSGTYYTDITNSADVNGDMIVNINGNNQANQSFKMWFNGTEKFKVTGSGNVGIGTSTPGSLLEISGSNQPTAIVKTTGTGQAQMFVGDASNAFGLQYYPAGNCCWPTGTSVLAGSGNGNLMLHTANMLLFYAGGAERARFSTTGNFGLGNDPTEKLDVTGNVKFSGALMPNNIAGTAGQVLTSAGPGLAPTWAAASGGSSQWTTSAPNIYYNTGNVGIGITAPTAKLDVLMGSTTQPALKLKSIAAQTANTFELQNAAGTSLIKIKPTDGVTYGQSLISIDGDNKTNNPVMTVTNIGAGNAGLYFSGAGGGNLELANFNASPLWLYTNKHAKWMVNNSALDPGSTDSYTFEHMNQSATTTLMLLKGQAAQTGDMLRIKNSADADLFRIPADGGGYFAGNVGIGITNTTTDPDYKLFVDKGIKTKKIKVTQTAWPDYVFHQQYKLPSLIEVEKYIKANNHLPEVPSAKEIETDGLNLGDNQATLLKKIEELTLYIIDLNKKSEEQNKKIAELEKRDSEMKEIKKQLEDLKNMILKK
jgi:hypothetical protein